MGALASSSSSSSGDSTSSSTSSASEKRRKRGHITKSKQPSVAVKSKKNYEAHQRKMSQIKEIEEALLNEDFEDKGSQTTAEEQQIPPAATAEPSEKKPEEPVIFDPDQQLDEIENASA